MQGRDDGQREFGDAESLAGHLLPAGSVFAFLAEHRQRLFPDGAFADLFTSGRGRPSILADVIASVMVLQALHGLSDRQTAEAVTFDLRWKAACGFAVTETGFHPSVLTYWRRRIAASDRPHRVLEAVTEIICANGVELDQKQSEAVALLALVAGQDVEPAEGSDGTDGRWRIARRVAPDRVISTVDPQARHAHKSREKKQDGFKAHVAVEPDTGLVTAAALTMAAGAENSDAARGIELLAADTTIADDADVQVLADSAYGSGELLAAVAAAGRVALIKPMPIQRPVTGGFTIDDFTVDHTARTATCPAEVTRPISTVGRATFGAICATCPLRARCTTSARGRKLVIGEHDQIRREHRKRARDPQFQADYRRHRPMVERSIAWLTRGARRVPYRGVGKNNAWWTLRAASINLRTLLRLGLRPDHGTWATA